MRVEASRRVRLVRSSLGMSDAERGLEENRAPAARVLPHRVVKSRRESFFMAAFEWVMT
jgi:hypothetical protein